MKQTKIKLAIFEGRKIRRHWDEKKEKVVTNYHRLKLEASDGKKYFYEKE